MAVKSIISVDVDTVQWERFQQLFEKYNAQLSKMPEKWAAINKRSAGAGDAFKAMTAALLAQNQAARDSTSAHDKQTRQLAHSDRLWTSMARSTAAVTKNVVNATTALIKWTGILGAVGGLLGGGGLFGIDRMAAGAANQRRSAMGLGMSTGEQRAFQINFERLVDPDAFLSWMNTMETDVTKQAPAYAMGLKLTHRTGDDAVAMLRSMRSLARSMPEEFLNSAFSARGLQVSDQDQHRLHDMGDKEFNQLIQGYLTSKNDLNIPDDVGKRWQELTTTLEKAGASIYKTFVVGLAGLAEPLEHLSQAAVKFVEVLLKSDLVKDAIDNLAKWLNSFSGEVSAPQFLDSVKQFTSDIGTLAHVIHAVTNPGETAGKAASGVRAFFSPTADDVKKYPGLLASSLSRLDDSFNLHAGLLETVKGVERSGEKAVSGKGAMGTFQLMPDTWKAYGAKFGGTNPFDPVQNMQAAARFLAHLENKYKGDLSNVLAAYNWGEGNVDTSLKGPFNYKGVRHEQGWLPQETRQYIMNASPLMRAYDPTITINIFGAPGHSATATVSGLSVH